MKHFVFSLFLILFLGSKCELQQSNISKILNISQEMAARIIDRIAYIDRLNTSHAPYYPILSNFLKERGYKIGCEIGVFTAGHAAFILSNSNIEKLYCVDSYIAPVDNITVITEGFEKNYWQACWETIYHYSLDKLAIFDNRVEFLRLSSQEASHKIANQALDFVFIDGDHSYSGALSDCINYYDKVRSGGIISGDDYNIEDVGRALNEFFGQKNLTINIYQGQQRFWWVEKP